MPLTPSQEQAASVRGRPLLVSAAAGSGKTRVLVERLMRYVDDGADIDEFLIITYTRAAAAELRGRILRELNGRLALDPSNKRLRRQTELCPRAPIGTIDSICGRILRNYVHLSALTPDFRVMEEDRAAAMRRAALNRVLEQCYEHIEEDTDFRALVDSVGAGRDDGKLVELVLSLYESLRSHPHPEEWMARCAQSLDLSAVEDAGETVWGEYVLRSAALRADYWAERLEDCLRRMAGDEAVERAYGEGFAAAAEGLRAVGRSARLGWDRTAACFPLAMKIKSCRSQSDTKQYCKAVWDACRDACKALEAEFASPSAPLLADMAATAPALRALLALTEKLDAAYAADKRRASLVDFSDQEHMVLNLLENGENGVAAELSGQWREVMVDEYQDVNDCQDRLFTLLSGGGRKLFLVGDVKQSIYRFRLANPGIFLRRYEEFAPLEEDREGTQGARILLRENFRSSPAVIDGVNAVFAAILSKELGEMDYDEGARLVHGRSEADNYAAPAVDFTLYDVPDEEEEGESRAAGEAEAAAVAERIRALVKGGTPVPDGEGGLRPLRYGDVAILLRSYKAVSPRYRAALSAAGVPCAAAQGNGFFKSMEVSLLLSCLAIIDNPRQDIPLIAVLRSPLCGFTPDELAAIRGKDRAADFYTALTLAAEDDERCAKFLRRLRDYRTLAPELSVPELLRELCVREDVPALLSAMPDAHARRQNLQALEDYSAQFQQSGQQGLFRFLAWMKRLAENGEEPFAAGGGGDEVQIMSIHRSKGLEFPVVFLSDTAHRFNLSDSQDAVLVHPRLGIAARRTDAERGIEYPTLAWRAIAACLRSESLSEEMRVLYVAMTRARERLYITAAWRSAGKKLEKLDPETVLPVPPVLLAGDRSMAQWLCRCARGEGSSLCFRVETPGAESTAAAAQESGRGAAAAKPLHIREKLDWRYPWAGSEELPSKLTASEWKAGELPDEEAAVPRPVETGRPRRQVTFAEGERPLSGAERGTAVHLALQFIDYARCTTRQGIEEEIQRLRVLGHLTAQQAESVDPAVLLRFFRSPLGQRILRADHVYREQRFTLLLPADALGGSGEDQVLFQGVVDCCIEEQGELTVIDYKTDYVTGETLTARAEHYAPQVRAYAMAMERIRKKPVKEGLLCFLRTARAVEIPLKEDE